MVLLRVPNLGKTVMNQDRFKPLIAILLILIAAPFVSALLSPWIYQAIQAHSAEVLDWVQACEETGNHIFFADIADSVFSSPFRRVNDRVLLVFILIFLPFSYRLMGLHSVESYGLARRPDRFELFAKALSVAVISMLVAYVVGVVLGVYSWRMTSLSGTQAMAGLLKIFLGGLLIGVLEETLFRGVILNAISRGLGRFSAVWVTSLLFAIIHFIKPLDPGVTDQWYSGFLLYAHPFAGASGAVGVEIITLFCMGVVLGLLTSWTRSVYVAIGLHVGWVWVMMWFRLFTENQQTMVWLFGVSRWISKGWMGPILALTILAVVVGTRKKWIALGAVSFREPSEIKTDRPV